MFPVPPSLVFAPLISCNDIAYARNPTGGEGSVEWPLWALPRLRVPIKPQGWFPSLRHDRSGTCLCLQMGARSVWPFLWRQALPCGSYPGCFAWGGFEFFDSGNLESTVPTDHDGVRQSLANREDSYLFASSPSKFRLSWDVIRAGSDNLVDITALLVSPIRRIQHYTAHTRLFCRALNT